jgi:hypothetical protein
VLFGASDVGGSGVTVVGVGVGDGLGEGLSVGLGDGVGVEAVTTMM